MCVCVCVCVCVLRAWSLPSGRYTYGVHLTASRIDWDSEQFFIVVFGLAVPALREICHKGSQPRRGLCHLNLHCIHLYNEGPLLS